MVTAIRTARWKIRWAYRIVAGIIVLGLLLGLYAYQVLESRPSEEFTPSQGFWIALLESVVAAYSVWSMYWGVPAAWRMWRDVPGKIPLFGWLPWQIRLLLTFYIPFAGGAAYGFIGGSFYEYAKSRKMAAMIWREGDQEME
jgi:hypothetical protein